MLKKIFLTNSLNVFAPLNFYRGKTLQAHFLILKWYYKDLEKEIC